MEFRGYLRTSTSKQEISLEAQEADIRQHCDDKSVRCAQIEADADVKGARAIEKCDGLQRIYAAFKPGDVLLVTKRDRLSRKAVKQMAIESDIEELGGSIVSLDGTGNGDTNQDWFMRYIQAGMSELEVRQIRERTKRAAAVKRSKREIWGQRRYGEILDQSGPRNAEGVPICLIECPEQQSIIRTIQSMRVAEISLRDIAGYLNDQKITAANGGAWRHTSVASVLATQSESVGTI